MRIIGIDPGTSKSGLVIWNEDAHRVDHCVNGIRNLELLTWLELHHWHHDAGECQGLVIETLSPRGMSLDRNTFATIFLTGQLHRLVSHDTPLMPVLMERDQIKRELLGRTNVPGADSKITALLRDEAGEKGTKANPGPCYGMAGHAWQALGAVWAWRQQQREGR
jgi:hypothetical protein